VNLQINVEAWEAEVSKALNLHKEKMVPSVEGTVKTDKDHHFKVEILQITELDERTKTDTLA
jgi:hypothetical protein